MKKRLQIITVLVFYFFLNSVILLAKSEALFSPHDKPELKLLELIAKTKKSLCCAVYQITSKNIVNALIAAHKRGVSIQVITDESSVTSPSGKADALQAAGIETFVFSPKKQSRSFFRPIMHNKFALFDIDGEGQQWLWTGSFNWTYSANNTNHENVVVTSNKKLYSRFKNHFEVLKKECVLKHQPRHKTKIPASDEKIAPENTGLVDKIAAVLHSLRSYVTEVLRR